MKILSLIVAFAALMMMTALVSLERSVSATWVPPLYNSTVYLAFRNKTLLNPSPSLPSSIDWYNIPNFNTTWPPTVCAVWYPDEKDRSKYFLRNFSTAAEATAAGAFVTHEHPCGYCSTTQDLSIYMQYLDLTDIGRECALLGIVSVELALQCYEKAGFTRDCSIIWMRDSENTKKECFDVCMKAWIEKWPNNIPANSTNLNACLECDEVKSGPIFKRVAGRTRRDSGLRSAINRPQDQMAEIYHYYY